MAKKVRVTGLKEAIQSLNEKQKKIDSGLLNILQDYTLRIEFQAKRLAPTDMGHLGQSISSNVTNRVSTISASANYAPFVEFGTGTRVKVPSGFEELAMTFYVNGKGLTRPQPFLIPSYLEQKLKYEAAIKKYKNEIRW